MKQKKTFDIALLVFRAVAFGLGIGVVCLSGMHEIDADSAHFMLGLGIAFLAITAIGEQSGTGKGK